MLQCSIGALAGEGANRPSPSPFPCAQGSEFPIGVPVTQTTGSSATPMDASSTTSMTPTLAPGQDHSRPPGSRKPVGLALQGGGSWGAYTWGVLDALLASRSLTIAQLSGTSAGAINAAIVASELAKGSHSQARKTLRAFWLGLARPAAVDIGGELWAPVERAWRDSVSAWLLSAGISPYAANPLGINPLR